MLTASVHSLFSPSAAIPQRMLHSARLTRTQRSPTAARLLRHPAFTCRHACPARLHSPAPQSTTQTITLPLPHFAYVTTAASQRAQKQPPSTAADIAAAIDSTTGGSPLPIHPQHPTKPPFDDTTLPLTDALLTPDGKADKAKLTIPATEADPLLKVVKPTASDIRDSELMFRTVWNDLLEKYGEEQLAFPKNIMWLAGAPGAGKASDTATLQPSRVVAAYVSLTSSRSSCCSVFRVR